MQAKFIKSLLDLAESYESEGGNTTDLQLEDFVSWLVSTRNRQPEKDSTDVIPNHHGLIAMYLSFMGRYAAFYSRRVFKDTAIYSTDDWGILITLYPGQQYTKTEVIRRCLKEKSSGNEVLKRMIKQGLIREEAHPTDGRSKLIALTTEGKVAYQSVESRILRLSNVVVADLDNLEKNTLLSLLSKMNRYHQPIFEACDEEAIGRLLGVGGHIAY